MYNDRRPRERAIAADGGAIATGATHVTVLIRNAAGPEKTSEGRFLVDTGATDCLVPKSYLEAIGLEPQGQRIDELADGTEISMDFTIADDAGYQFPVVAQASVAQVRRPVQSGRPRFTINDVHLEVRLHLPPCRRYQLRIVTSPRSRNASTS